MQVSNNNNDPTAATVIFVVPRKFEVEALPIIPSGATGLFEMTSTPKNTTRIIIEVDPPLNGTLPGRAVVTVTQGATTYSSETVGFGRMVLEVLP